MFDYKRALASVLETHPDDTLTELYTPWGETIDPDNVLPEYPRPQMVRQSYLNLNGLWDYAFCMSNDGLYSVPETIELMPDSLEGKILVPFSPESLLSGVKHRLMPKETLWYRRNVSLAHHAHMRILLHFEAVDFACSCFVNGKLVGIHHGSYAPFYFDITDYLSTGDCLLESEQVNFEVVLAVKDPSEYGCQPRGKQRLERGSIWCTAQSGIWQTVWLEEVPQVYLQEFKVSPNLDAQELTLSARIKNALSQPAEVDLAFSLHESFDSNGTLLGSAEESIVVSGKGECDVLVTIPVANPHAWSPSDPYLYDVVARLSFDSLDVQGCDEVKSYCAFRTVSIEQIAGCSQQESSDEPMRKVICLNHEPLFLEGILDQGYWPDGLLTAPSDDALKYDIELAKSLGFNMMRKHLKTENARWYYLCDKLGMLVWQDMINGGAQSYSPFYTSQLPTVFPQIANRLNDTHNQERFGIESDRAKELWIETAIEVVEHLGHFQSIIGWTIFNEAWGQFDAVEMTQLIQLIDNTRIIDQTSGWCDQRGGDLISEHNYFRDIAVPQARFKNDRRVPFISEFGGYAYYYQGHCAASRAYGYAVMDSEDDFRREVQRILNEARALYEKGLGGFVYTQLSDVEDEVNGLVTYDRRIIKFLPEKV